jgi:hypothetical protein
MKCGWRRQTAINIQFISKAMAREKRIEKKSQENAFN